MTAHESTYARTHTLAARQLEFELDAEVADLLEQARGALGGRIAKTLVKEGPLRVTVVGLREGTVVQEHHVDAPASVQVLAGRMALTSDAGSVSLGRGGMVVLDTGVAHALTAQEDCAFLVTVAGDPHAGAASG